MVMTVDYINSAIKSLARVVSYINDHIMGLLPLSLICILLMGCSMYYVSSLIPLLNPSPPISFSNAPLVRWMAAWNLFFYTGPLSSGIPLCQWTKSLSPVSSVFPYGPSCEYTRWFVSPRCPALSDAETLQNSPSAGRSHSLSFREPFALDAIASCFSSSKYRFN